jgi:hypothetical protein
MFIYHPSIQREKAVGGDGLRICRVAANTLNESREQPPSGGPPSSGLAVSNNPSS